MDYAGAERDSSAGSSLHTLAEVRAREVLCDLHIMEEREGNYSNSVENSCQGFPKLFLLLTRGTRVRR